MLFFLEFLFLVMFFDSSETMILRCQLEVRTQFGQMGCFGNEFWVMGVLLEQLELLVVDQWFFSYLEVLLVPCLFFNDLCAPFKGILLGLSKDLHAYPILGYASSLEIEFRAVRIIYLGSKLSFLRPRLIIELWRYSV